MREGRVLIVDDDPVFLEALPEALRLRMAGVTVETADSAAAALDRIADRDYFVAALYRAIREHVAARRSKERQVAMESWADELERVVEKLERELRAMPGRGEP